MKAFSEKSQCHQKYISKLYFFIDLSSEVYVIVFIHLIFVIYIMSNKNLENHNKISQLPRTLFSLIFKNNLKHYVRQEKIWDMYSSFYKVTWDNLLAYELYSNENFQGIWQELYKRDYEKI